MGLFSGKTKVIVATSAQRAIPDKALPNSLRTGLMRAMIGAESGPDVSIVEEVMSQLAGSIGVKADRYYAYGRDHYAFGLPSGQYQIASQGRPQVQAVLEALEGAAVNIDYCNLGPPNDLHIGWMQLIAQYGYNPASNEIASRSAARGRTVWLQDMVVVVPAAQLASFDPTALSAWGVAASAGYTPARPYITPALASLITPSAARTDADPAVTAPYVRVYTTWVQDAGFDDVQGMADDWFDMPVSGYDQLADYFHVKYMVAGQTKYWMYRLGEGTYPSLDAVLQTTSTAGTFFPFLYFRFNKHSDAADKTAASYQDLKRLSNKLGLGYDAIADAVNQNPDIKDVQQAMLMMAVPAQTTNAIEQRYLFDFFSNLAAYQSVKVTQPQQIKSFSQMLQDPNLGRQAIIIQDRRFKMALSNTGISTRLVAGVVAAVGGYASGSLVESMAGTSTSIDGATESTSTPVTYHFYRKQITSSLYQEVVVADLRMLYYVLDGYYATADETDDILLIPIDRSITENYSLPDREELYSRSLHYIFNSALFIKIKWYQTGIFQVILVIVAVVIAIYTASPELVNLVAAAAAGSTAALSQLTIVLLEKLFWSLATQYAFKIFARVVGGEFAMVIAMVAVVAAGANMLQTGSITGAPWAPDLLKLASGITRGVSAYYTDEMKNLAGDYAAELRLEEAEQKELTEARKLLETSNVLDPFVIFGESPNEFYNRTVHSGNVGIVGISAISSYVDNALRLPEFKDTLGDRAYEL